VGVPRRIPGDPLVCAPTSLLLRMTERHLGDGTRWPNEAHPHEEYGEPIEIVNSPRLGLCGYTGPADPPY